jgi:hypothetical protein
VVDGYERMDNSDWYYDGWTCPKMIGFNPLEFPCRDCKDYYKCLMLVEEKWGMEDED